MELDTSFKEPFNISASPEIDRKWYYTFYVRHFVREIERNKVELAQFEKSIQFNIRYEKPEARNEFVTVLTLEAGLGEKHQLEFFVEYHDGLRQLLDFEPVATLEKANYWLEQFFDSESFVSTHFYDSYSMSHTV